VGTDRGKKSEVSGGEKASVGMKSGEEGMAVQSVRMWGGQRVCVGDMKFRIGGGVGTGGGGGVADWVGKGEREDEWNTNSAVCQKRSGCVVIGTCRDGTVCCIWSINVIMALYELHCICTH